MHFDGSGIRLDQAVEHFKQCGLARAVVAVVADEADEADALAAAEFEGDVAVGPEFAGTERR